MKALHCDIPDFSKMPKSSNTGLWYDKYCNKWSEVKPEDREKITHWSLEQNKGGWIETVTGTVGDKNDLKETCKRLLLLAGGENANPLICKTDWRFVTGLGRQHPVENGFAWHHTLGVPYLPGSSVKGMVRAWVRDWIDEEEIQELGEERVALINRIFGPKGAGEAGNVIFFDALPTGPVDLEPDIMTPHYGPYYSEGDIPGDWHDPVPIPFLTVAAEQDFMFLIEPRKTGDSQARDDARRARGWLKDVLELIGAGAKTAVGYGRMIAYEEENIEKRKKKCLAKQVDCRWVDEQLRELASQNNSSESEVLRSRGLANRWSELKEPEKSVALECIRRQWEEKGWWDKPPGRAARQAKAIYES